ncbi:MAG: LPS export ABC transporter periplasmic protein LptC [Rhodocyclales bacterium CG_4_9_14_3_um_filter_68_10]|nr:MAG: LPS export ABC transporter periplasmic protein LptC [Rhodocyclales bacterium CG_4_9_14_3_um_filter_68_10]
MRLRTDSLFPLAVLALLAGLTFWLERITREEPPRSDGRTRHDPDFIVDGFDLRQFGESGGLHYALVARRMVHYPDDATTEASQPALSWFGAPATAHLSADRGRIDADGTRIVLTDNVEARREATARTPALRVMTSELTVLPDSGMAVTTAAVRIVQGASVITGTGLEMNREEGIVKLKANVRATLDRPGK